MSLEESSTPLCAGWVRSKNSRQERRQRGSSRKSWLACVNGQKVGRSSGRNAPLWPLALH